MRTISPLVTVSLLALLAGCSGSAVATVRVNLQADLSGTVTTSALLVPTAAGPLEGQVQGAEWQHRANLYCAQGRFAAISKLKVADLAFTAGETAGIHFLRVDLPRGAEARWPAALLPPREARPDVERTFDPHRQLANAASTLAVEVTLPGEIISHAVKPLARGVSSEQDQRRVTLTMPIDRAVTSGSDFVWLITWK